MGKFKVYVAGPLFSESDIRSRRHEAQMIRDAIPTAAIFNPIDAPYNEDKSANKPTPQDIYWGDRDEIVTSDVLVFNFEDIYDPGVALEIGLVCGDPDSRTFLIGVMSDIRLDSARDCEVPSFGVNHMVLGAVQDNGYIVKSYEDAVAIMKEMSMVGEISNSDLLLNI